MRILCITSSRFNMWSILGLGSLSELNKHHKYKKSGNSRIWCICCMFINQLFRSTFSTHEALRLKYSHSKLEIQSTSTKLEAFVVNNAHIVCVMWLGDRISHHWYNSTILMVQYHYIGWWHQIKTWFAFLQSMLERHKTCSLHCETVVSHNLTCCC